MYAARLQNPASLKYKSNYFFKIVAWDEWCNIKMSCQHSKK